MLPKDAMTLNEETTEKSLLTPLGQQQHYQLGEWLRERYQNTLSDVLKNYSPTKVYMESSAYERTMVSASSLALGLFPKSTRGLALIPETPPTVPIYTQARHNDIAIRAYDKCPAFHDALQELYSSDDFIAMEQQSMPLLERMAQNPVFGKYVQTTPTGKSYVPLQNIWNVYDAIQVAKTECPSGLCPNVDLPQPMLATDISNEDWMEIQALAHTIELQRYGPSVAQNFIGGFLLQTIIQRMQSSDTVLLNDQQHAAQKEIPSRFFLTSAHYPTMLGLFAALQIPFDDREVTIPEYAAAIIFEVYQDSANNHQSSVRMLYKSGIELGPQPIVFTQGCRTDLAEGCPLETFIELVDKTVLTPQQWCTACQNTQADVCLQQQTQQSSSCSAQDNNVLAAVFFGGMLTTAILVMIFSSLCRTRRSPVPEEMYEFTDDFVGFKPTPPMDAHTSSNGRSGEERHVVISTISTGEVA